MNESLPPASTRFRRSLLLVFPLLTYVAVVLTCGLVCRIWRAYAYSGVVFYHSSESRGAFRIFFDITSLFVLAGIAFGVLYASRIRATFHVSSRRQIASLLARSYGLIWLVVSVISVLIIIFHELPAYEPITGG